MIFKLTKLRKIYSHSVTELGFQVNSRVNKTHLKNQILEKMPELEVATKGQEDVFLVYRSDIAKAVTRCHESAIDNENAILKQAAKIIKEDMFKMDDTDFSGTFESNCQVNAVHQSLLQLVNLLLNVSMEARESKISEACLTIAQLVRLVTYTERGLTDGRGGIVKKTFL